MLSDLDILAGITPGIPVPVSPEMKKIGQQINKDESSKAFCSITDRQTQTKYLQNRCTFMKGNCTKKLERYLN